VTLAEGPAEPRLIAVSTATAYGGVHQYARLAGALRGRRSVAALPLIGFAAGELLPGNPQAGLRSIAESALRAADGAPFALLGWSSGGALAYAAAGVMESTWGIRPAAVIMLDTISFAHREDEGIGHLELLRANLAGQDSTPVRLTSTRLSAMAGWLRLLNHMEITPISTPALLIRATRPLYDGQIVAGSEHDPGPVTGSADIRLVDADHVSLGREDAPATVQIIEEWLTRTLPPSSHP
jgi:hypothetical protein